MSQTYNMVSAHVFASKRDVEQRLANHNYKCVAAIIEVQLYIAVENLNYAMDMIDKKIATHY